MATLEKIEEVRTFYKSYLSTLGRLATTAWGGFVTKAVICQNDSYVTAEFWNEQEIKEGKAKRIIFCGEPVEFKFIDFL